MMEPADLRTDSVAASPASGRPLRLWPMVAIAVAFWVVNQASYQIEIWMFARFMTRLVALASFMLITLVWWLRQKSYPRGFRWSIPAIVIAGIVIGSLINDSTVNAFVLVLGAVPLILTGGILWLLVARRWPIRSQRLGFVAMVAVIIGTFACLRWNGVDGRQQTSYSWRWTKTSEQKMLADSREQATPTPAPTRTVAVQPGDWIGFRGGDRESTVAAVPVGDWAKRPPRELWKHRVGPSWSSFTILDGMAITQEQRGDDEVVSAYDVATGKPVWTHADKVRFDEPLSGAGPRSTPGFCDGRIYTSGGKGKLNCLNAADGSLVWSKDVIADHGGTVPPFGASSSPLIVDNLVVAFAGGKDGKGMLAYDAATGKDVWTAATGDQTFSSPQLATLQGVRQILIHDNSGLRSVRVDDGKELWMYPADSQAFIPMLQPHVLENGDLLLGWNDGIVRLSVEKSGETWTAKKVWDSNRLKPGFNEFVIHKGFIYGLDDGILCCLDLATGKRVWKKGRYDFGQMLLLPDQDRMLILCEKGDVVLVATNPKELEELGRFKAIQGKTWNHPVLAHGRLFVRNAEEMACFDVAAAESAAK